MAGVLVGLAVWLWRGGPGVRRAGSGGGTGGRSGDSRDDRSGGFSGGRGGGRGWGPPMVGTPVSAAQLVDVAELLATALDAGLPLPVAWAHVVGDDPRHAVLVAADSDARAALLSVRAALRLSEAHGVPAAAVLRAAAVSVRDRLDSEAARRAATSGPVAAAWIVAGLPVIGPLLGAALGIDPVGVLTQTAWGRLCGAAGVTFLVVGALWSRQLVMRARSGAT